MSAIETPALLYQFHVLLRGINPVVWRRLLLRSDSTITDLHYTLQIAFHWSDFHLHRFLIRGEYDFGDLWQHQVRFEATLPLETGKTYPRCIAGARAAPPEDCGGPQAYMQLLDHHRWHPPAEEICLLAESFSRLLPAKKDEPIRECIGDLDELQEAVDALEAYHRFQPDRFDRQSVNRRLRQYATGDQEWLWE